ncbi:hypothetical protein BD779DRAFT_1671144 [Infundibulicybe gibba]|nr:hypothetical protein BD779DRAFT_1671144 [Infundibulicybe gibba]
MDKTVKIRYSDPERLTESPPSQLWNKHLLTVDRSKELPKLRQNPAFWRGNKRIAIIILLVLVALVAGTIVGVVAAVSKKRHTDQPSSSAGSIPPLTSSSSSTPGPISTGQSIPSTLATAFQSSSWIWLGATLAVEPAGNWAFRKTLPTSTTPAKEAVVLLTVDNSFVLYHNGQSIASAISTHWQSVTAVHVNLDPNSNVFAIQARNDPSNTDASAGSYAGLLASIQISYADGNTTTISSDATWRVTHPVPDGFQSPSFDDAQWQSASMLVKFGSYPWSDQVVIPQGFNFIAR